MNELEQRLKTARLLEPSGNLDRRIDEAFDAARKGARGPRLAPWLWGAGAAAAAAAAGLVLFAGHWSRRVPPPAGRAIVYQVEAQGRLRDLLVTPAGTRGGPPPFAIRFH